MGAIYLTDRGKELPETEVEEPEIAPQRQAEGAVAPCGGGNRHSEDSLIFLLLFVAAVSFLSAGTRRSASACRL